ncbi:MAG: alcohol dehydrogenase catalytic domain-containing protein [Anaerolineae bacterium]
MKSSFFYGSRDIRIEEVSDSEPGPGQVLLEVSAVGICGSDLHSYVFGNVGGLVPDHPFTLGHEAAGTVLAVGEGVTNVKVGQRVAIDPATPCYQCERCLAGEVHLCLQLEFMGTFPYNGAMRERMIHPARCCVPIPDSISDIGAAMLEPLGIAIHGNELAEVKLGEDVAVLGCGAIGLLLIRMARLSGARHIFATDKHPWRLALAETYGADQVIDIREVDPVERVMQVTNGRGVDVAIEAAWVEETANQCMDMTRYGGRVVIVGIPAHDDLRLGSSAMRRKELKMVFSRRMKHTYPTAIALATAGQVDIDRLATHQFTLDETAQGFETASTYVDGVVRAIILPNKR